MHGETLKLQVVFDCTLPILWSYTTKRACLIWKTINSSSGEIG